MTYSNRSDLWATFNDPRIPLFDQSIHKFPFKPNWFVLVPFRGVKQTWNIWRRDLAPKSTSRVAYLVNANDVFDQRLSPRQVRLRSFCDPNALNFNPDLATSPQFWYLPQYLKIFEHYADKYGKDSIKIDVESVDGTRPDIK